MCPPAAQFLYDFGLCNEEYPITVDILKKGPGTEEEV